MLKVEEHTIGSTVVRITQLNALTASKGLVRLSRVVGDALAGGDTKDPLKLFAAALGKLHEDEIEWFARFFEKSTVILVRVSVDAEPGEIKFNLAKHFTESLKDLLTWIALCISVNYADFLSVLPESSNDSGKVEKTTEKQDQDETISVSADS